MLCSGRRIRQDVWSVELQQVQQLAEDGQCLGHAISWRKEPANQGTAACICSLGVTMTAESGLQVSACGGLR